MFGQRTVFKAKAQSVAGGECLGVGLQRWQPPGKAALSLGPPSHASQLTAVTGTWGHGGFLSGLGPRCDREQCFQRERTCPKEMPVDLVPDPQGEGGRALVGTV